MKKSNDNHLLKSRRVKPWMYIAALLVNVLVFVFIGIVYNFSDRSYSDKLFNENIHNVENLNIASANAAYTYATSMGIKIDDTINYIEAQNMSYDETVQYLCEANTDPDRQFQLILSGHTDSTGEIKFGDYSGISVRTVKNNNGSIDNIKTPIQYGSGYYDIFKSFTDIDDKNFHGVCFAPEFTDPDTKQKCFAVYRHTYLTDSTGYEALYTILLAVNSNTALNAYEVQKEFKGQSAVLINEDGDYIIKSTDYRNTNFYDYITNYNGLSQNQKEKLQKKILKGESDTGSSVNLFYKNYQGIDCVFSVAAVENGWYSITGSPLSSFNLEDTTMNYSLIILVLFVILFALDGLAIYFIGKTMSYNISVAEQATKEANDANQAKSRFLSNMSHELRTPLNAIIGLVSLSGDSIEDPPVLKDYLKKIDISSKLLLQLISDILDVSAIESNKMKLNIGKFDIPNLITSLSAIYYNQCAAKDIEFNVILKNMHSETLIGDSMRINQVLLNFLSNAVKFTPSGGKVTLSAEQVGRDESSALIRFNVKDTGCGINEELSARLFKPFERASGDDARKYSGTGLGLSIAKSLTELMNGHIGVDSTEGSGSDFWIEIPFDIPSETIHRSFSPIKDIHVLAAISNDDERKYIGEILSGFGVDYRLTENAYDTLKLLLDKKRTESSFDICILDWKMSDLNSLDTTCRIREEFDNNELRIVILAYNPAEASSQCLSAGADIVLGKPVFPSALYNLLAESSSDQIWTVPELEHNYNLTGKRILLVEDNKLNTEIARLLLNKVGLEVESAENGRIGCDAFTASEPEHFDAILMDIQMPVMDGYESTRAIRESAHPAAKKIPIIAMSADAFAEDVEKAQEAGMNEHISKPVAPDTLYSVLKKNIC